MTSDGSQIQHCKEQQCLRTWNVRSMNQGKLEVIKQEMARVNINILRISELKWTGMDEFNIWPVFLLLWARPDIPGSYAILLFIASKLASITSHTHYWVLFLLWLHPFTLSGVISPLISSSMLGTCQLGSSSFSVLMFSLFTLFMGFSRQEYWSGLPYPSPEDHILSELSTMTCLSWVALHGMAHVSLS